MAIDDVTLGVLRRLDAAHQLVCDDTELMFNQNFDTDVITIHGPTSRDRTIRFDEIKLCDYLNAFAVPVTEQDVVSTLCDLYNRPERYSWVWRSSRE